METLIGFIAGYVIGTRDGKDGVERLKTSFNAIKNSPEARRLLAEALSAAETMAPKGLRRLIG